MRVMVLTAGTQSLFWFRMDMMKALVSSGHDVVAVGAGSEGRWAREFAREGIRYRRMRVERTGTNPLHDIATIASIRSLLREERPDALFTFHGKGNVYGNIAARMEGFDNVYSSVEGLGNVLGPSSEQARNRRLLRAILKAEYRFALRGVRKVFFVNGQDRDFFVREGLVAPEKTVLTDGIGVNLDRFALKPVPSDASSSPVFLFSGRMLKEKGVAVFAEASRLARKAYPDLAFRCVAIGPFDGASAQLRAELQPYLDEGSLEYGGEHRDVRPFLEACSAVVLPSSYNEGLPKCLMEGMSVGRAVVTTDAVGCRETVEPGVNGFLVASNDPVGLAACLVELASDRALREKMGAASRRIAERRFDVRAINGKIFEEMGIPIVFSQGGDEG